MNPVLEGTHAKLLHFLAWEKPLPHYLANKDYRIVSANDRSVMYYRLEVVAQCINNNGIYLVWTTVSSEATRAARERMAGAAPTVFDAPAPELPEWNDISSTPVQILGWLGVLAYRATWRTRLKYQKVRQPW